MPTPSEDAMKSDKEIIPIIKTNVLLVSPNESRIPIFTFCFILLFLYDEMGTSFLVVSARLELYYTKRENVGDNVHSQTIDRDGIF